MHLPPSLLSLLVAILTTPLLVHSDTTASPVPKPCQIRSPSSGSFFDLRPLQLQRKPPPSSDSPETPKSDGEKAKPESYHSRGYDYPANFTLNICGAAVEDLKNVEGISKSRWQNVSAFYKDGLGDVYSIGQQNSHPVFRGRKLILNYTNGSPCPELDEDGVPLDPRSTSPPLSSSTALKSKTNRYKSTLLTFTCDTSPSLNTHPSISFLGSPDHCTYVFEVRSRYACAGATGPPSDSNSLSPAGVFLVILGIAFLVYLIGGCVYQRNVMHQRGWRQLPNYSVWAGCLGFIGVSCRTPLRLALRLYGHGRENGGRTAFLNDDERNESPGATRHGNREDGSKATREEVWS